MPALPPRMVRGLSVAACAALLLGAGLVLRHLRHGAAGPAPAGAVFVTAAASPPR
jgi:hypothetical protein